MILDVSEVCSKMNSDLITFIHNIVILIKIAVPIVLVIFGMIDLGKGVIASKEDEIKKGQHTFLKRLLAGVIVFFMISIAQLVVSVIDKDSDGDFWSCANGILNGKVQVAEQNDEEENTNKTNEKREERYIIIEQCCIEAGGEVIKGEEEDGTQRRTCATVPEIDEKYDACYNAKMGLE